MKVIRTIEKSRVEVQTPQNNHQINATKKSNRFYISYIEKHKIENNYSLSLSNFHNRGNDPECDGSTETTLFI